MIQVIEMSHSEKVEMYQMIEKDKLIEMLIEANNVIQRLTEAKNLRIADVSNCAFNKVLNEFRQWQRQWDLYDKREVLKKPQSSDAFIKRLKNKYVIGFKHCC